MFALCDNPRKSRAPSQKEPPRHLPASTKISVASSETLPERRQRTLCVGKIRERAGSVGVRAEEFLPRREKSRLRSTKESRRSQKNRLRARTSAWRSA